MSTNSFHQVLDQVLFGCQDSGNTASLLYIPPLDNPEVTFTTFYRDGDDFFVRAESGELYQIPPIEDVYFDRLTSQPNHFFIEMNSDGDEVRNYEGRFLSSPPSVSFGV